MFKYLARNIAKANEEIATEEKALSTARESVIKAEQKWLDFHIECFKIMYPNQTNKMIGGILGPPMSLADINKRKYAESVYGLELAEALAMSTIEPRKAEKSLYLVDSKIKRLTELLKQHD